MKTQKTLLALAVLALVATPLAAAMTDGFDLDYAKQPGVRLLTEVTNEPAWFWMVWFAGAGNISDITISNTLQGGYFKRHPVDEHAYQGMLYTHNGYGDNFEFPAGSEQFYGWAFGLWVGSNYPAQIGGGGSDRRPNVSKCAFNCDLGAMAVPEMENAGTMQNLSALGLYFSDMTIPDVGSFEAVGDYLFAQSGTTPLGHQTIWPFADTVINVKRRAIGMPEVSPENGDIISKQDTYACAGDWIPAKDATAIWIRQLGPYDVWGQGIRVEQRTYCWDYDYNKDYVFFNYKIKNMNDFPLDSVYLSWFMDNDIGATDGRNPGDDGAFDDLIGFDQNLNMGYTYDASGSESGWMTPAGYIGCIFLETPYDIGLTGFETWQNGFEIDRDGTDSLKYSYMASTDFVTWENPNDVRMLMNCGPIDELAPGEEVEITVAVACAYSLDELKEKTEAARIQFENGYFGYSPPPNPALSVVPGDSVVYLNWSSEPEQYVDPMSGQKTFEGYRVYKSLSGISGTWQLLADYDIMGSTNPDTVVAEHSVGPTKSTIEFIGFHSLPLLRGDKTAIGYTNNTYTITFEDSMYYEVYDVGSQKLLIYNNNALAEGGYAVLTGPNGSIEQLDVAEKADGRVTFTGTQDTEIPLGTIVATDSDDPITGYVEFETTKRDTIDSTGSVTINVEAVLVGVTGNVYPGAVTTLVDPISGVTSVTNTDAIDGGRDGQTKYAYVSGDVIFIDGVQVVIEDGDPGQAEPGDILEPRAGEHYTIKTYASSQLGGQEGLRHFYIDDDVENGQIYYYSVTSYSKPQPTEDVGSLEGGITGKTYWAVPRSNPLGWQEAVTTNAERISGSGTALVEVEVVSPEEVTGDTYLVGFKEDPVTGTIRLCYFRNETEDLMLLDDFRYRSGEYSGPVLDGVFIKVAGVSMDTLDTEELIDSLKTGWLVKNEANPTDMNFLIEWEGNTAGDPAPVMQDFVLEVVPDGQDVFNQPAPFKAYLHNDPSREVDLFWSPSNAADRMEIRHLSKVELYWPAHTTGKTADYTIYIDDTVTTEIRTDTTVDTSRWVTPPLIGDQILLKTLPSTTPQDIFRYSTEFAFVDAEDSTRTLDDIKVVPNPYYIRAEWDLSQYDRHVMFQYLPSNCTIRIFSSAGLLIRTIEHAGEGEDGFIDGNAGSEPWDLLTEEGLDCTSGLYIWQVETEDGEKAWGKFAIVR